MEPPFFIVCFGGPRPIGARFLRLSDTARNDPFGSGLVCPPVGQSGNVLEKWGVHPSSQEVIV